jgi:Zn-finger nucleic acid-binding protein
MTKGAANTNQSDFKGICPRCHDVLSRFPAFGVEIHQCPTCHGMWFSPEELDAVKNAMDDDVRWKELDLRAHADRAHFRATKFRCPNCGAALGEFGFGPAHIELEFCAKCNGVWLEKGRLIPVVNYLRRQVALEPLDKLEKDTLRQFVEIFVGHKGPWNEIKDFAAAWRILSLRFMIDHPTLAAQIRTFRNTLPF